MTLDGTVGIRIPCHPATLQIIAAVGAPVTATSLNRAGEPPGGVSEAYLRSFDWPGDHVVPIVQDDAAVAYDKPSTLVRVIGAELVVLRAGPIDEDAVRRAADPVG